VWVFCVWWGGLGGGCGVCWGWWLVFVGGGGGVFVLCVCGVGCFVGLVGVGGVWVVGFGVLFWGVLGGGGWGWGHRGQGGKTLVVALAGTEGGEGGGNPIEAYWVDRGAFETKELCRRVGSDADRRSAPAKTD